MTQTAENEARCFNANEHVIQLKSKQGSQDYLPVQWRLVWFREQCPEGTIDTEEVQVELDREVEVEAYAWNNEKRHSEKVMKRARGYARFKAVVTDGKGGRATGTKSENAANFPDYIEKAETGAIGRALAALGYGTQFAPELDEEHRIVDAPVEQRRESTQPYQSSNGSAELTHTEKAPVQQQAALYASNRQKWPYPQTISTRCVPAMLRPIMWKRTRLKHDGWPLLRVCVVNQWLSLTYSHTRERS